MIRRVTYGLSLTKDELKYLLSIRPWSGKQWDEPLNDQIASLKDKIREQLEVIQLHCSYCGLKLKGTSKGEIEHIAAKASYRHPSFTFTLKNLCLSCNWCNRPEKKGNKETIKAGGKKRIYSKCDFLLVHPYIDDPTFHYEWTDNQIEILIQVRNNSPKGIFSINMFKLDSPEMNEHRAAQVRHDELKATFPISNQDEQLLNDALDFIQ